MNNWKRSPDLCVPTHVCRDGREQMVGFVRKYPDCWFARAYVSYTHHTGFFVKSLAEGKALVDDMLGRRGKGRR